MTGASPRTATYVHAVAAGSPREAGRIQAEQLASRPEVLAFLAAPHPAKGPLDARAAGRALACCDRHCPGLAEEIAGFAEVLGLPPERVAFYPFSFEPWPGPPAGQCSHAVVLPGPGGDGHVRVVRNYEFDPRLSDLRLVTLRLAGRPAHIGFSEFLFGRDDGMNAHGLCVTMSAGAPLEPFEPGGATFWPLVRTLLDRCASVPEALEVVADFPLSFNINLLLADRSGDAAVVEMASSHRGVRRIRPGEPGLVATNHYVLPEMRAWDRGRRWNSVQRRRALEDRLAGPGARPGALRALQAAPATAGGLCAHDATGGFATLWAEQFDLTAGTVAVCFGPPDCNPWRTFGLDDPVGLVEYPAAMPDEPLPGDFWRRLGPGCEA